MGMAGPFFTLLVTTTGSLYPVGPVSVAGAVVFVAVGRFTLKLHAEEPVLAERHAEAYARYRSRVARYLDVDRILGRCPPAAADRPN
jgi:protein-S-isoprenylcysteine O-methyltransferase Ste14